MKSQDLIAQLKPTHATALSPSSLSPDTGIPPILGLSTSLQFTLTRQKLHAPPHPPSPRLLPSTIIPCSLFLLNPPTNACRLSQVVQQEGVYANGQVVVQPLPAAVYGDTTERTVPLRRLEAVLTEEELQEHSNKEMQKVSHNSWSTAVCRQCGCCTLLPLKDHLTYSCIGGSCFGQPESVQHMPSCPF